MSFKLWTGKEFSTFKASGYSPNQCFSSKEYQKKIKERFRGVSNKSELNPLNLALSIFSKNNTNINILDFGGGLGSSIKHAKDFLNADTKVNYLNIDNKEIIETFNNEFSDTRQNIKGSTIINAREKEEIFGINKRIDFLLLGSVIQYIENEIDLIKTLSEEYKPRYIILDDVHLAEKSFITTEIFYDFYEIPFKFIDKQILNNILKEINGRIVFMSDKTPIFQGKEEFYNTDNLPSFGKITRTKVIFIEI